MEQIKKIKFRHGGPSFFRGVRVFQRVLKFVRLFFNVFPTSRAPWYLGLFSGKRCSFCVFYSIMHALCDNKYSTFLAKTKTRL